MLVARVSNPVLTCDYETQLVFNLAISIKYTDVYLGAVNHNPSQLEEPLYRRPTRESVVTTDVSEITVDTKTQGHN